MSALIDALPALLIVVGFLSVLGAIAGRLSRIADALEYANELTRSAWQGEYLEGRIQKPTPVRRVP